MSSARTERTSVRCTRKRAGSAVAPMRSCWILTPSTGPARLRADAAIELQILGLARDLRLQIPDRARHFRLLARPADALRVDLGETQVELVIVLFECSMTASSSARCCATARRS